MLCVDILHTVLWWGQLRSESTHIKVAAENDQTNIRGQYTMTETIKDKTGKKQHELSWGNISYAICRQYSSRSDYTFLHSY